MSMLKLKMIKRTPENQKWGHCNTS